MPFMYYLTLSLDLWRTCWSVCRSVCVDDGLFYYYYFALKLGWDGEWNDSFDDFNVVYLNIILKHDNGRVNAALAVGYCGWRRRASVLLQIWYQASRIIIGDEWL